MRRILLSTRPPVVNALISDRGFRDHVIAWRLAEEEMPEETRFATLNALERAREELTIFKTTTPKIGPRDRGLALTEVRRSLTPVEIKEYKRRMLEKA